MFNDLNDYIQPTEKTILHYKMYSDKINKTTDFKLLDSFRLYDMSDEFTEYRSGIIKIDNSHSVAEIHIEDAFFLVGTYSIKENGVHMYNATVKDKHKFAIKLHELNHLEFLESELQTTT